MRVLADQIDRVLQIQKNYNNYSLEERKTAPEFIERGQLVEESIVNFYNNFLLDCYNIFHQSLTL